MKSAVIKRSVLLNGRKTSVSIEDAFWEALKSIASERKQSVTDTVAFVSHSRRHDNLSSCIRMFVLAHYVSKTLEDRYTGSRQSAA